MELLLATRDKFHVTPKAVAWWPKGSIIVAHRDEDIHREWVTKIGFCMAPERRHLFVDWEWYSYVLPLMGQEGSTADRRDLFNIADQMRRNYIHPEEAWEQMIEAEPRLLTVLPVDRASEIHVTDLWPFSFREKQAFLACRFDDNSNCNLLCHGQVGIYRRTVAGVPVPGTSRPVFGRLYRVDYWENENLGMDEASVARAEDNTASVEPIRSVVLTDDDLVGNTYRGPGFSTFDPFGAMGITPPARGVNGGPGGNGGGR